MSADCWALRYRSRQNHTAQIEAQAKYHVAVRWRADPAMKSVTVEAVKLESKGNGEFVGHVEYSMGSYRSAVPISITPEGKPFAWKIDAHNDRPVKLENYGAFQVFYEHSVTDEQAGKAIGWLDEQGHIGKETGAAFLRKAGPAFALHLPMHDGISVDAEYDAIAADVAKRLSAEVFAGAPVEVHLCNRQLKTLKIAKDR
jgi:hypothetical protein